MEALTDIQQAVYDYTRDALQQGHPFPSLREIASHFGFQHTTARFHLKALEKKGYVQSALAASLGLSCCPNIGWIR